MTMYFDKENKRQFTYRVVTMVMFAVAVLTLCMRMIVGSLGFLSDRAIDAIFSVTVQVGVFLLLPFLVYRFLLKKDMKQIAEFSSVKKIKWYYLVIAVGVGFCVFIATIGISTVWQNIIAILGYKHSSSPTVFPEKFNAGLFVVDMILTAVLPAICEEFLIRGGVLTTMRASFTYVALLVLMGIIFGLFHQNITQVFYTSLFGALMAFLTVKLNSIFPAMIIHFINNGTSVYLDYAENYGWKAGGGFFDTVNAGLQSDPMQVLAIYVLVVLIGAGLVALMLILKKRENLKKQKEVILDSGYDQTNHRVVMFGEENKSFVEEIGMEKAVYGDTYSPDEGYAVKVRDNAFILGALAVTVLSTVATFIWGLF